MYEANKRLRKPKGNQEWTIQGNLTNKTQNDDKQNKKHNRIKKTNNTDSSKTKMPHCRNFPKSNLICFY
jgi:hypothetical protein